MDAIKIQCGYLGCSNLGESRWIQSIIGIGKVELSLDICDPHYDLRDIDDDVIDWLKEEWKKRV